MEQGNEISRQKTTSITVLDHGYVKLVDSWGSDSSIIEAARMSTNKGFLGWTRTCSACADSPIAGTVFIKQSIDDGMGTETKCEACAGTGEIERDSKLLRYLYTHKHMSPFEMCGLTVEVQAPIMVFREWHRHRTQSYNEMSARYTPIPDVNYQPTLERCLTSSTTNKQAGTIVEAEPHEIEEWLAELERMYALIETHYQSGLKAGIPKELARLIMPVGRYSRMRASANLRNWMQFLTLRLDAGAQWEIQQYASAVETIASEQFPRTMALFQEGQC